MRAETIAIIPARFASTRFPGKPLALIDRVPMVVRVAKRAAMAAEIGRVFVATDDDRIRQAAEAAAIPSVMTPSTCATGTDRIAASLERLGLDLGHEGLVVNVQGDEPLIDPADIDALVRATRLSQCGMGTLARPIRDAAGFRDPNVVKVVAGKDGRALYFSRAPIPSGADPAGAAKPLQHVGIYAYRPPVLARLVALGRSALEAAESLEQLRALENGIPILVTMCVSAEPTVAVDTPEDLERVARLLASNARSNHGN